MAETIPALIEGFVEAMNGKATNRQLEVIRGHMDSWKFRENVRTSLRKLNDPDEIARLRDGLRRLQRATEGLASRRQNGRELFRIGGFGGSIGLFGAALVTAVTIATPAVLFIPITGSAAFAGFAAYQSKKASEEITILGQIAETARDLADWKDF